MAFKLGDRVREVTTTTGTGSFTLGGTISGYQAFSSALATNDTCWYCCALGSEWEVGLGTLTASTTLARTVILASSNAGAAVSFSAGSKDIFITAPAVKLDALGVLGGAGQLTKSGSNLSFAQKNGARLAGLKIPSTALTLAPPSDAVTFTNGSSDISRTAHGLTSGTPVKFATGGTLPTNFTAGTTYYVIATGLTANAFRVAATIGGTAITAGSAGSGTHTVGTPRFIYVSDANGDGTLDTLEASLTTHAADTATGFETMSGNATKFLVGYAFDSGSAWLDSVTQRLVRSWLNSPQHLMSSNITSEVTTTSTTFVEMSTSFRLEFLNWANELIDINFNGTMYNSASIASRMQTTIALDGTVEDVWHYRNSYADNKSQDLTFAHITSPAEGYHWATLMALRLDGGTLSIYADGVGAGARPTLKAKLGGRP